MNTQELKQYINRVLGNNIRCLLPSYWWKRLLGLIVDNLGIIVDKINDLIPNVTSEEELNGLESKIGSLATVAYKKKSVINPSECHQMTEYELKLVADRGNANGIDLTTIYGVEFPITRYVTDKNFYAFFFKDGIALRQNILYTVDNIYFLDESNNYPLYSDDGILIDEHLEYINTLFKDGVQFGMWVTNIDGTEGLYSDYDTIDKVVKFITEVSASDAYIKNQYNWDKLAKENYQKVNSEEIQTIKFFDFLDLENNYGFTLDGWEKMKAMLSTDEINNTQPLVDEYIENNKQVFRKLKNIHKPCIAFVGGLVPFMSKIDPALSSLEVYSESVVKVALIYREDQILIYFHPISATNSSISELASEYRTMQLMETGEVKVLYRTPYIFNINPLNDTGKRHNKSFVKYWYESINGDSDLVGRPLPFNAIYYHDYPEIIMLSTKFNYNNFIGTYFEGTELKQVEISAETGETTITTLGTLTTS